MIKTILLLVFSFNLYAMNLPLIEQPFINLSIDKSEYKANDKSVVVAELNTSATNVEYEYFVEGTLNGSPVLLSRTTDYIWSAISVPLPTLGLNTWSVKLYFAKKLFSKPILLSIEAKESELALILKLISSGQNTPANNNRKIQLENEIAGLRSEIVGLRRFIQEYTVQFNVIPNPLPSAYLSGPSKIKTGLNITFDGSASVDSDGSIASYEWNFGDGSPVAQSNSIVQHAFTSEGEYQVSLKVTDNLGGQDSKAMTVKVFDFICNPKIDYLPKTCSGTFIASSMNDLATYSTSFGLENDNYKSLKVNFDLSQSESIEIHSPCKIVVERNQSLKADNLCLDAKDGLVQSNEFSINTTRDLYLISSSAPLLFPSLLHIQSRNITIGSSNHIVFGGESLVNALNFEMKSGKSSVVQSGSHFTIGNDAFIEGFSCDLSVDAQILAGHYLGNCF